MTEDEIVEVRGRRVETLRNCYGSLLSAKLIDPNRFYLSRPLVDETISHYIRDLQILKYRYCIKNRVELPKSAGLMAAAILRYRPVVPHVRINDFVISEKPRFCDEMYANESVALLNGVSICLQSRPGEARTFLAGETFQSWADEMMHFMHHRVHSAEGFIMIFRTLKMFIAGTEDPSERGD
jgi:hypothetical protein